MKKVLAITIAMLMVLGVFNGCSAENKMIETTFVNDEMKIPYTCDLDPEYGADSVERDGDHTDSPYFKAPDFYNMKPTESLTILSNFKTQQQTSEWSCGVSSALMIMNWYGKLEKHNEEYVRLIKEEHYALNAMHCKEKDAHTCHIDDNLCFLFGNAHRFYERK